MLANAGATHSQPTQDTPRLTLSRQIFHPWVTLYYCFCYHLTAMNHSRAEPQSWVTAERLPRFSFCFPDTTVSPWPSHRLTVRETLAESFPISCLSQQRTAQLASFIHRSQWQHRNVIACHHCSLTELKWPNSVLLRYHRWPLFLRNFCSFSPKLRIL